MWPTAAERARRASLAPGAARSAPSERARARRLALAAAGARAGAARRASARRRRQQRDRGVAHLPVRLRAHGALLQPPAVRRPASRSRRRSPSGSRAASRRIRSSPRSRAKYGEKVLSSPTFQGFNWLAWMTPFARRADRGRACWSLVIQRRSRDDHGRRRAGRPPRRRTATGAARAPRARARRSRPGLGATHDAGHASPSSCSALVVDRCWSRSSSRRRSSGAPEPALAGGDAGASASRLGAPEAAGARGDQGDGARPSDGQALRRGPRRRMRERFEAQALEAHGGARAGGRRG